MLDIAKLKQWIFKWFLPKNKLVSKMKKDLQAVKIIRDLTACTYIWNPGFNNHNGHTILLIRQEAIKFMAKAQVGVIDGYSPVYLIHYKDDYSPYASYYRIKVCDDKGVWHVLDSMLMVNYGLKAFYLISSMLAKDIFEHRK